MHFVVKLQVSALRFLGPVVELLGPRWNSRVLGGTDDTFARSCGRLNETVGASVGVLKRQYETGGTPVGENCPKKRPYIVDGGGSGFNLVLGSFDRGANGCGSGRGGADGGASGFSLGRGSVDGGGSGFNLVLGSINSGANGCVPG